VHNCRGSKPVVGKALWRSSRVARRPQTPVVPRRSNRCRNCGQPVEKLGTPRIMLRFGRKGKFCRIRNRRLLRVDPWKGDNQDWSSVPDEPTQVARIGRSGMPRHPTAPRRSRSSGTYGPTEQGGPLWDGETPLPNRPPHSAADPSFHSPSRVWRAFFIAARRPRAGRSSAAPAPRPPARAFDAGGSTPWFDTLEARSHTGGVRIESTIVR